MCNLALLEFPTAGDAFPIILRRTEEKPAQGQNRIKSNNHNICWQMHAWVLSIFFLAWSLGPCYKLRQVQPQMWRCLPWFKQISIQSKGLIRIKFSSHLSSQSELDILPGQVGASLSTPAKWEDALTTLLLSNVFSFLALPGPDEIGGIYTIFIASYQVLMKSCVLEYWLILHLSPPVIAMASSADRKLE